MKVTASSVAEIKATKFISSSDFVLLAKGVAGKKADVEIDGSASVAVFIDAAKTALKIDTGKVFADVIIKRGDFIVDKTKSLADNRISDGTSVTITFKIVV